MLWRVSSTFYNLTGAPSHIRVRQRTQVSCVTIFAGKCHHLYIISSQVRCDLVRSQAFKLNVFSLTGRSCLMRHPQVGVISSSQIAEVNGFLLPYEVSYRQKEPELQVTSGALGGGIVRSQAFKLIVFSLTGRSCLMRHPQLSAVSSPHKVPRTPAAAGDRCRFNR